MQVKAIGVGIGLRQEIADIARSELVDWVEVITEHYLDDQEAAAELTREFAGKAIVPHGIEMSIGTVGNDEEWLTYVDSLAELVKVLNPPWVSDHLCFTKTSAHTELATLTPLPCTRAAADHVAKRARLVQSVVGRPFLLENITYHFSWGNELSETEFIARIVDGADCGLLLDLTNLYCNSKNHGFDPLRFLDEIPVERVMQVHLAGGEVRDGVSYDTHSEQVPGPVWDLLDHLLSRHSVPAVMLERDNRLDQRAEVVADVERARAAYQRHR